MKFFLFTVLIMTTAFAHAKDSKKNRKGNWYIKGIGFSALTDFGGSRCYAEYQQGYSGALSFLKLRRLSSVNLIGLGVNYHFILKEMGKEKSISLNFHPRLGFGLSNAYLGSFYLPVGVNYNMGNVSTYSSRQDQGFTFGLGLEYIRLGLLQLHKKDFNQVVGIGYDNRLRNIIQPYATLGIRYISKNDIAQEINIKFGLRPSSIYAKYVAIPASEKKTSTSYWFTLSRIYYLTY
jgi:hypothetical protein